jgi:hypothetical protein
MERKKNSTWERINHFCTHQWFCLFIFSIIILITGVSGLVSHDTYKSFKTDFLKDDFSLFENVFALDTKRILPWTVGELPNGDALFTASDGHLLLIRNYHGNPLIVKEPVAIIETGMPDGNGLLSIAIHPGFKSNRQFYLCINVYEDGQIENRIELWRLSDDGTSAHRVHIISKEKINNAYHSGNVEYYVQNGESFSSAIKESSYSGFMPGI